LKRKVC
jgi:hypothetical protein